MSNSLCFINVSYMTTEHNISITGQVPGSMYTALMDHKIIQDPYYRDNDIRYRWIGVADWTYSRVFNGRQQVIGGGVDTLYSKTRLVQTWIYWNLGYTCSKVL